MVGGTVVHHLQHTAERIEAASNPSCHSAAVHDAELPVVTDAAPEVTALECELCATRLLVVLPDISSTSAPSMAGTTRVVLRTHLAPAHVSTHRTIRGPPLSTGGHLA